MIGNARTAPPFDRWAARRGTSAGGVDTPEPRSWRTLIPGVEDTRSRYPATAFDGGLRRDRAPWFHRGTYMPPASGWTSWTAAGPVAPSLHMSSSTYRREVGTSSGRFPFVKTPTGGRHDMTPNAMARTAQRYVSVPQMMPARTGRLAAGQYTGQTYSQITRPQGA